MTSSAVLMYTEFQFPGDPA